MSDLLDALTDDLKPVKPLRSRPLWLGALAGLIVAVLYIWFLYGPRPELMALTQGAWPARHMPVVKPLMFLALGLGALWGVSGLARPEGRPKLLYVLPALLIGGIVFGRGCPLHLVFVWPPSGIDGADSGGMARSPYACC